MQTAKFIAARAIMIAAGVMLASASATAATDFIDFETLADGVTPTTDQMVITNDYSNPPPPATYTGVTFSLSNGQNPRIAKVGTPATAFQGDANTQDPDCWPTISRDDMPQAAAQSLVECSFLTRDDPVGLPPDLIIDYDSPVTEAGGLLLDIDGPEVWEISAFLNLAPVGTVVTLTAADASFQDAAATPWSVSVPGGFDRLVVHYADATQRNVGLAFDKFYTNTLPAPIPTLSEWALIILGVLILGMMTYVTIRRRKAVQVSST